MNDIEQKIGEYQLLKLISESHKSKIYRAKKANEENTVILKVLKKEFSSAGEIARVKQESKLIENVKSSGIIHSKGIIISEDSIAIILEDTTGISLKEFINQYSISHLDFLPLAIQLAATLAEIHNFNIVHKDIKPHNIIVNHKFQKITSIKITDFGISAILNEKLSQVYDPDNLAGTLPYISPEQTGRMNLAVDYRTDLYSLGITFYEMLTGTVPFISKDPLELIHSHIAKEPIPLHEINKVIPEQISNIIQKLISKSPEDRYQSAYGLKNELEFCYNELKNNGKITDFKPGFLDITDKFIIPQKIFGRDQEIALLLNEFNDVSKGSTRIMLVSGAPGIGKSRMVNEIHKSILKSRGYFISGKYDQMRKEVPFSSIIQAFQYLMKQILSENEERIFYWKKNLLESLGGNGKIITTAIPEAELILGVQNNLQELNPEESQNRFNHVFINFVKALSKKEHPLTLFLDDMQWADQSSLNLIKNIISDKSLNYFFLICSYRDSEIKDSHPFVLLMTELKRMNKIIKQVHLNALTLIDVQDFIEHLIGKEKDNSGRIGRILHEKTRGNPFFLNQFTKTLYEDKIIRFSVTNGWEYDADKIRSMAVTENVIELMAEKISRLSIPAQEILKLASCIGNRFSLEALAEVNEKSFEETLVILSETLTEGLVTLSREHYKFLHDRIQEAAYSLLSKEERIILHKKIGEFALKNSIEKKVFDNIFYITDQLNKAESTFVNATEKERIAELNLLAGKKALSSAAYEAAYHYLHYSLKFIGSSEKVWQENYNLTLTIHTLCAEAAYLCLKYDEMESLSKIIISNSRNLHDRIRIYEIEIKTLIAKNDLKAAVNTGLEILKQLGIHFPKKPGQIHALIDLIKTKILLLIRKDDIVNLPKLEDQNLLAAIRIISGINSAAYWAAQDLLPLIILKVVYLSLRHGNSSYSPYNYAGLGLILSSLEFFNYSNKIGKLAIELSEKNGAVDQIPRTYFVYNTFIRTWIEPIRKTLQPLEKVYTDSLNIGDIEFASHAALVYGYYTFLAGIDLEESLIENSKYVEATEDLKQLTDLNVIRMYKQISLTLTNREEFKGNLCGSAYNENTMLPVHLEANDKTSLFHLYLCSLILNYFFGNFKTAIEYGDKNLNNLDGGVSVYALPAFLFYDSLARIAFVKENELNNKDAKVYINQAKDNLKKISRWAEFCHENLDHKKYLLEAEIASIENRFNDAVFLYEKALSSAKENLFIQDEALTWELAGKFYTLNNLLMSAKSYLYNARNCYDKWGAAAVLIRFDQKYAGLTRKIEVDNYDTVSNLSLTHSKTSSLDISTIIKFSHVLSSEIDLNILLEKILHMSLENAGAESGTLILEKKGKLFIEAYLKSGGKIKFFDSVPIEESKSIPMGIINYTWKTKESLILSHASKDGLFINDKYIQENKIKSVICAPILYKRRLSGILYLENNLTTNAFLSQRLDLLSVLSSQAAISIENARLLSQRENSARFEKEMEITARIQRSLIPSEPESKGYIIKSYMLPAESVGGDYYDVINTKEKDWLVIGDVSGHGILSGLVMMMVQTSIHLLISRKEDLTPADLLIILLDGIEENIKKISRQEYKYMTITFLSFDESGNFTFAGQHQDLIIYRNATDTVEIIETEGIWIGMGSMMENKNKFIINKYFQLNSGDILLLYTDGITEGVNSNGEMLGIEGLANIIRENGKKSEEEIKQKILEASKEYKCNDDISFLLIRKV